GGSAIDYAGKPATQIVFRDITKRDERERQIRYLADLVENVSDAVISTDMDFKILSWNKAAEDLYGWTRHEVKGKTVKDVTRIEYPANNQEDVLREFSRTGFWKGEVIQKRKDGTPLTIHASVSLVRDRAGKPAGAVAINRDITERKQAEEALRESEDRFRTLLETAYDGAGIHENGRLIEVNQALASMLGYEPSEMIGMEAFQFVVPESWQLVKESIQSEFDKPYEVVAVRKDGSTFPIEIIGKSCRYQGRQVRVSAVRDITARKESVETLRRERDFTKSLIDTAQTIILSLDTEGRIIHFNPYMEEVTGYRLEDVQGKDWCTTFIPKRDQKRIRNLFLKAASGIQTRGNINSILTKEGHEREIEWYDKTLKDADGTVIGMLSVGQDITERKQAERALQESEEKWRSLAENSPDHIILLDKDAKIIFINHTVPDLTKEQVIGTSVYTYVPSESVPIMKACFKRILKTGQSDHYEIDYITSEGETRNFETRVAPVMHDGEIVGFIENSTDVTEKKRAVQALQDSEERLKILFENLTIGIYRSTPEGQLLEANPAMLKLLGYPSFEELKKRNLEEEGFEPAYPRSQFKEIIERDGEVLGLESAWKKCDGSTIYVRENARAVRGEDGKTLYYEGTAEDITERKVNEENLEFERKQLLSIFDGLNEAVNVNDPATHNILYANSYLRKIFGRNLTGEICHKVFHNSDSPCENCGYSKALENSGKVYKWEFRDNASKRDLAVTSQAIRWPDG
ncbi:PAS domain S-box protein, partial [bacterium]|nr:PAS domain S-box protein [bacterium]